VNAAGRMIGVKNNASWQAATEEVCLDAGKRRAFGVWPAPTIGFDHLRLATKTICRCRAGQQRDPGPKSTDPANVGSLGWLPLEYLFTFGERDPGLLAARPDVPCRSQPRCVVEAAGTHTDHAAARLAVHPARTIRAY